MFTRLPSCASLVLALAACGSTEPITGERANEAVAQTSAPVTAGGCSALSAASVDALLAAIADTRTATMAQKPACQSDPTACVEPARIDQQLEQLDNARAATAECLNAVRLSGGMTQNAAWLCIAEVYQAVLPALGGAGAVAAYCANVNGSPTVARAAIEQGIVAEALAGDLLAGTTRCNAGVR
jgi:hypothetical protein